jgi:hypothetical protein
VIGETIVEVVLTETIILEGQMMVGEMAIAGDIMGIIIMLTEIRGKVIVEGMIGVMFLGEIILGGIIIAEKIIIISLMITADICIKETILQTNDIIVVKRAVVMLITRRTEIDPMFLQI